MNSVKIIKRTLIAISMTVVSLIGHLSPASQGGSSTGGGFAYRDTTYKHIKEAQNFLGRRLNVLNQNVIDSLAANYTSHKVEKSRLIQIIQEVQMAEMETRTRLVDGGLRELDMDYDLKNGGRILALKPLFASFHKLELSEIETHALQRKILHEASHIFGIGNEDDEQSFNFSESLLTILKHVRLNCGLGRSIDEKIASCARIRTGEAHSVVMAYSNPFQNGLPYWDHSKTTIYDRRAELGVFVAEMSKVNMRSKDGGLDTAELICSKVNDLDGQVVWRAASAEQLNEIRPLKTRSRISGWQIAIENGRASYIDENTFGPDEVRVTEVSNTRRINPEAITVYCAGSLK